MNERYTHIDLFSGIGGFSLAAQWNGVETRLFVELDPFCQRVLKARFGAVADTGHKRQERAEQQAERSSECNDGPLLISDIRDVDGTRFQGSWLLTGGFPCQPFSCAGKRKGTADNRFLWPEMCRVIREAEPEWVLAENVPGLLSIEHGLAFERVLADLEDAGYETLPLVIPACGIGAPHRRDRLWIVAHAQGIGSLGGQGTIRQAQCRSLNGMLPESYDTDIPSHNPELPGRKGCAERTSPLTDRDRQEDGLSKPTDSHAADTNREGLQGQSRGKFRGISEQTQSSERGESSRGISADQWREPWPEIATRLCRVDDGVSPGLARPKGWRVNALKALGNSIVPQIAYEIIRAMKEST